MDCPDVIELEHFVLQRLDDAARSAIDAHVVSCAPCAEEIKHLTENLQLAAALRQRRRSSDESEAHVEAPPETIGPYRILRKLGQGGMGTVYEAEQTNPRRVVALKILRQGLVSASMLSRFRREVQTLGRLRHPGIAQIYEAGTHVTPYGPQPYFAMELVRGSTVTTFAEKTNLPVGRRLNLMADICDAVQHAHQRGVIHRDLKPENILVDDSSGDSPQPKILDFGVARIVDPEARAAATLQTTPGQIVGTVAYMSPEQAVADPGEVDTRADVYALGVICFELLSGRLPYHLNRGNVAESVRAIVQDEPTQLGTIDRALRGDVSTIVAKALEKEKSRRYQSAAEMAADIRRHLRDEPISAHAPSTIYQLRKFARRNKGLVAGIAAAFVLLVLGVIGTSIGLVRANRARSAADRSAAEARSEAAKQTAVTGFFTDMLASASPRHLSATDRLKGRDIKLLDALKESDRKIDAGDFKNQPEIEIAIRDTMAATFQELGEYDLAAKNLEASLVLARKTYGDEHLFVANDLTGLAVVKHLQGKADEAEPLARASVRIYQKIVGENDVGTANAYNNLSSILQQKGNFADAEAMLRRALAIRQRIFSEQEDRDRSVILNNLGTVLSELGKRAESEAMYREALRILRKTRGDEHPDVATGMQNLAQSLKDQDKPEEAESLFRAAIAMQRKLFGDENPNLVFLLNNLAYLLTQEKKFGEAEKLYKEAIDIHRKHFGDDNPTMATMLNNLGTFYDALDKLDDAEAMMRKTLAMRQRMLPKDHPEISASLHNLGYVLVEKKQFPEAEQFYRQAIAIRIARLGEDHPETAASHMQLGDCLTKMKRFDEAERELLLAHRVYEPGVAVRNRTSLSNVNYLLQLYKAWGKPEKAAAMRASVPTTRAAAARRAAATQSKSR